MAEINKKIFLFSVAVIVAWIVIYVVFIGPFDEETENIKENIAKMQGTINASLIQGESLIDEINLKKISEEQVFLERKTADIKNRVLFIPNSAYSVKTPGEDVSIKFNSLLTSKYSQLKKFAETKGIKIPLTLGFRTDAVPHDLLPVYFERLDIIEQMVILAIEKGCKEIVEIKMDNEAGSFFDQNYLSGKYIKKDSVMIKLKVNFKSAVEIIYSLVNDSADSKGRFIAVPRISMQSENTDLDLLTMILAVGTVKNIDLSQE